MCWNFQSSLVAWIIGLASGIFLLKRNEKNDLTLGLLILTYSSMQLWEAMMWYNQPCGKLNLTATKLAYIALWSHVLAIGIGLYLEQKLILPLVIGILVLVIGLILFPSTWECSTPGKNGHLAWGFDPTFYMLVFSVAIILCLAYIRPLKFSLIVSFLFLSSFALSYLYGSPSNSQEKGITGSFWCWVCAAFSVLFVLIPKN